MSKSSPPSSLKVLRPLGSDAASEAYLASVPGFAEPLVVRALKAHVAADEAKATRFIESARSLIPVQHPSLVRIHSAGRMQDGRVYALTDFVDADTLQSRGTVAVPPLVELGLSLCDALEAVHAAGLSLGPLSPGQVFLPEPRAVLDPIGSLVEQPREPAPALDVRALAVMLQAAAAPGDEKFTFETAIREALTHVSTAQQLRRTLEGLRSSWASDTQVSGSNPALGEGDEPGHVLVDRDLSGRQLGHWQLEKVLGEGAMGRVYLGRHTRIGREAAVKVLKAEHARQADLVQRFIAEATAVNAIKNPHIVEVFDFGEEKSEAGGRLVFCVMELLHGEPLSVALAGGNFEVARAARVGRQLAQALHAAHEVGVVHRDVKPENVYLHRRDGESDYVKVLDFGVAKLVKPLGGLTTSGTQAGMVIGTPEYMAPEQALGMPTDARADIYAVGLVLYELLTGTQPFLADTFGKLVVEITQRPAPPLPPRAASGDVIPPQLAKVVARCLEKEASARFQSAAELAAALEPFTVAGRMPLELTAGPVPDQAELELSVRRSRAPLVGVLATLVLFAGAGAWWFTRPEPEAPVVATPQPVVPTPAPAPVVPATVRVSVTSTPPGAQVVRTDTQEVLGTTPVSVELARADSRLPLDLRLPGYEPLQLAPSLQADVQVSGALTAEKPMPKLAVPSGKGKVRRKVSKDGTLDPFTK